MISEDLKPLCSMVSKDVTRYHLNGVHMSKELQMAVSTDGHRAFGTRHCFMPAFEGKTIRSDIFLKDAEPVELRGAGNYPNIKQFIPSPMKWKNCVEVRIPSYFAGFDKKIKGVKSVPVELNIAGAYPVLSLTNVSHKVAEHDRKICFNAQLIAPIAGREVFIRWNGDIEPILITPELKDANDCDWFTVLMPMRGGEMPAIKIPESFLDLKEASPSAKVEINYDSKCENKNQGRAVAVKLNFNKGEKWKTSLQSTSVESSNEVMQ